MSAIEDLLARVRKEHGWVATYCQFGPAMECTCGHLVDDHHAHQNQMIADALRGEALVETVAQAIATTIGDWDIDQPGAESRAAARAVIDSLYGTKETT